MGCCLSKTNLSPPSLSPVKPQNPQSEKEPKGVQNLPAQLENKSKRSAVAETEKKEENRLVQEEEEEKLRLKNKVVFVIQHRKSHDKRSEPKGSSSDSDGLVPSTNLSESESSNSKNFVNEGIGSNMMAMAANGTPVRTPSYTKEEVDAILIQCGRLSRNSSENLGSSAFSASGRKYSGSKRSHDFDRENVSIDLNCEGGVADDDERQRRRQSRGSHRRRTPSRSRERDQQAQRSGSRERASGGGGGRRVSRSPGRRSDSPIAPPANGNPSNVATTNSGGSAASSNAGRPGKMVSVPATVSSLSMEKSNNGEGASNTGSVKRVLVKRNVGEAMASSRAVSPRSRSPARSSVVGANGVKGTKEGSNNQQNQPSLSRNSSRKAEHSPYRRTPLTDLDMNSLPFQPLANKSSSVKGQQKSKEIDEEVVVKQPLNMVSQNKMGDDVNTAKGSLQGIHRRTRSRGGEGNDLAHVNYCRLSENQQISSGQLETTGYDAVLTPVIVSASDTQKLPSMLRSRSSRWSRDLDDINVDSLLNPSPATNYNSLLLQDIQNFHQKTTAIPLVKTNPDLNPPFSLPECISKACSIVEAVADLNSYTSSNATDLCSKNTGNIAFVTNPVGVRKRMEKSKDPFVESEVNPGDDLTEPSLHKYITVRKRGTGLESSQGGDFDEQESSGSNSIVTCSQSQWLSSSSSSWEPNSADSSDCWTSKSREEGLSFHDYSQRKALSNPGSRTTCARVGAGR